MKVISILNQKGGSGKTTIATHLARAFQLEGHNVVLVDTDPQGSARDWASVIEDQPLPVVGIDRPTLERDLKVLGKQDYIIIDGAPRANELAISAIKVSDAVLIPVQPSPYDLWATSELVDLVKARIDITDGKLKAAFIVSRAIKGTKLSREVGDALNDYGLWVMETHIVQRVDYPTTAAKGLTVLDTSKTSTASQEIIDLMMNVKSFIG